MNHHNEANQQEEQLDIEAEEEIAYHIDLVFRRMVLRDGEVDENGQKKTYEIVIHRAQHTHNQANRIGRNRSKHRICQVH